MELMQEQIKLLDKISEKDKEEFKLQSRAFAPEESCGLLIEKYDKTFIKICNNAAVDKTRMFVIDCRDYIRFSKLGKIVGSIHSHVNKNSYFSILDKMNAEGLNISLILYYNRTGEFFEYTPCGYKNDYLDRDFKWGERDCLSLVIDYYKKELNINIGEVFTDRAKNFFARQREAFSKKEYLKVIDKEGFTIVKNLKDIEIHDIIFMKEFEDSEFPTHLAIHLGDNYVLHQVRDSKSRIEYLTPQIKNRIECVIRHRNLI